MFGVSGQGEVRVSSGLHIATGSQDVQRCEGATRRVDADFLLLLFSDDPILLSGCRAVPAYCYMMLRLTAIFFLLIYRLIVFPEPIRSPIALSSMLCLRRHRAILPHTPTSGTLAAYSHRIDAHLCHKSSLYELLVIQ